MRFRLIVHPRMEGRLDMAVDEAIAEAVGAGASLPTVRLYGFAPPTLSLGRFQKIKDDYDPELMARDGVTLVRRPTGGHAVLHDSELTYAVALPKGEVGPLFGGARKREVYLFIARILIAGLANLGITGTVNSSQKGDLHNPDCFGSTGEYEISGKDGRKLIGSAQMTTRHAILQHGSVPMANPGNMVGRYLRAGVPLQTQTPTCLNEELGWEIGFAEVQEAFSRAFRSRLQTEDSELIPTERERAEEILAEKYASDAWNLAL